MAHARIRITSDGKLKVPGRKGEVEEIPWRDRYRRRAIRTLSQLLKAMPEFEDLKEKPIERSLWMEYEEDGKIHRRRVAINDTVLSARLSPSTHLLKLYPGLSETHVTFEYMGGGWFNILSENGKKREALNEALIGFLQPLYTAAFSANLSDQQIREMIDAHYAKRLPKEKPETVPVKEMPQKERETPSFINAQPMEEAPPPLPKMPEPTPPAPLRGKAPKKPRPLPSEERAEPEEEKVGGAASIEEIKKEIEGFSPKTFVERAAYERYLQAISRPWAKEREEEVHEVFYRLITSKRRPQDFKHYYNQLKLLVPEWLEAKR
jgi:hypothetical protein